MANKKQVENKRGVVARRVKGFRDIDPSLNQLKWKIINAASEVYKKYGFEHWDTPILEYADCLGKYLPDDDTVDKGVYSFKNPEIEPVLRSDGSELRDENAHVVMENQHLSMRYDLTSPLARRYAEGLLDKYQRHMLTQMKPPLFRRYQFGPVYRYEIKLSPGRFREFWQLDFDNVGTNDVAADAEVCMILSDALEAIGLERKDYIVKVNNRKILTGYLKELGVEDDLIEQNIIRVIDKMDKIGLEKVALELGEGRTDESGAEVKGLGLDEKLVNGVTNFIKGFSEQKTRQEVLADLQNLNIQNETAQEGLKEMVKIDSILSALNFDEERVIFDPSLVRGLAYYTGPVYEVESLQSYVDSKGVKRRIGSICGGGRYDGLVENLLGIKVPATGASIGVDRLAELLILTKKVTKRRSGPVLIPFFDEKLVNVYQRVAKDLRDKGIETEVYYGMDKKKMKKQMAYADDKNCPFVILIGSNEIDKGVATVKNLKLGRDLSTVISDKKAWNSRVQEEVKIANLAVYLIQKGVLETRDIHLNLDKESFNKIFKPDLWNALNESIVPFEEEVDNQLLLDELYSEINDARYFPSPPREFIVFEKSSGVSRRVPTFSKKDYCLYFLCIKLLEEQIALNQVEGTFGGWPLENPLRMKKDVEDNMEFEYFPAKSIYRLAWSNKWREFQNKAKEIMNSNEFKYSANLDISNFYDSIDLSILQSKIKTVVPQNKNKTVELLFHFLKNWNSNLFEATEKTTGIPQDEMGEFSRILANFYLLDYDLEMEKICMKYSAKYLRYADDQIIFAKDQLTIKKIIYNASIELSKLGLNLNNTKLKEFNSKEKFEMYWAFENFELLKDKDNTEKINQGITMFLNNYLDEYSYKNDSILKRILNLNITHISPSNRYSIIAKLYEPKFLTRLNTYYFKKLRMFLNNDEELFKELDNLIPHVIFNNFHYNLLKFYASARKDFDLQIIKDRINELKQM